MNLTEKLEAATKDYEASRARLDKARIDYERPQQEYAETKANLTALTTQITQNEALLAESKPKLSKELRRSNGERTEAVKNLLSDRRNTEELVEELQVIVKEVEKRMDHIRITISPIVVKYQSVYEEAAKNLARVKAYRVLVDCAPKLREALVSIPQLVSRPAYFIRDGLEQEFSSKEFILKEISELLEADELSPSSDLGKFDLGAFPSKEIKTPGMQKKIRDFHQDDFA